MHAFVIGVFYVLLFLLFVCVFGLVRNTYVYVVRNKVLSDPKFSLSERLDRYEKLPSYEIMTLQFWVWNYNGYLEGKK